MAVSAHAGFAPKLYDTLRLYISRDAYHLIPESGGSLDTSGRAVSLVINRRTSDITATSSLSPPASYDSAILTHGVFGIISLLQNDYLIVITSRKRITRVLDSDIYLARDFKVYPIRSTSSGSITDQISAHKMDETFLLSLVKGHLYSGPFYYTYGGLDLTSRLQTQSSEDARPLWQRADDRFFWNKHLQKRLIALASQGAMSGDVSGFVIPVMFGFCEFKTATINSRDFIFGVISRRSRYRAGTRYFSRGIDERGNVSNFNETEQIVVLDRADSKSAGPIRGDIKASYVQVRGSVPLYWAEVNNLRYKPDLVIMDLQATVDSLRLHIDPLVEQYGDVYIVNLVNQKGYEKPVKEAFERAITDLDNSRVHYTYFDFHHECKGLRFDRVSLLIDRLEEDLYQQGYFYHDAITSSSRPQRTQTSVVRTNCMDSLDRTNVVQSTFAKWALTQQLRQAGVLSNKETIDDHQDFIYLYRNIWADNADGVSKAYSGTGALKTDYTRTGKRTNEGLLQDGVNSIMRYVKNNFLDGPRQDSYDLITGTWQPSKNDNRKAFIDHRPLVTRAVPYVALATLAFLVLRISLPVFMQTYVSSSSIFLLFDMAVFIAATYYMLAHGVDYVAWPRLHPLSEVINYSGKGYTSGKRGRGFATSSGKAFVPLHKQVQNPTSSYAVDHARDMEMAHPVGASSASAGVNPSKKRLD